MKESSRNQRNLHQESNIFPFFTNSTHILQFLTLGQQKLQKGWREGGEKMEQEKSKNEHVTLLHWWTRKSGGKVWIERSLGLYKRLKF
jgi:hypothetical protein